MDKTITHCPMKMKTKLNSYTEVYIGVRVKVSVGLGLGVLKKLNSIFFIFKKIIWNTNYFFKLFGFKKFVFYFFFVFKFIKNIFSNFYILDVQRMRNKMSILSLVILMFTMGICGLFIVRDVACM